MRGIPRSPAEAHEIAALNLELDFRVLASLSVENTGPADKRIRMISLRACASSPQPPG